MTETEDAKFTHNIIEDGKQKPYTLPDLPKFEYFRDEKHMVSPPCKELTPYESAAIISSCNNNHAFSSIPYCRASTEVGPHYTPPPGIPGDNTLTHELDEWVFNHLPLTQEQKFGLRSELVTEVRGIELKEESEQRTKKTFSKRREARKEKMQSEMFYHKPMRNKTELSEEIGVIPTSSSSSLSQKSTD